MIFATGLLLCVVGIVMVRYFGADRIDAYLGKLKTADHVGAMLIFIGVLAWENLP